jgi:uncharacterized membrane protein YphA (DoxX/SURF4 family)
MRTIVADISNTRVSTTTKTAVERVTQILTFTYGIVPIVAGADKFFHILVNWDQYLAPAIANILPFSAHTFMLIVGVIEIIAGILVFSRPKVGSAVVSLWLVCIAFNLVISGQYFDVAVRDTVMAIGAFCLFTLTNRHEEQ